MIDITAMCIVMQVTYGVFKSKPDINLLRAWMNKSD